MLSIDRSVMQRQWHYMYADRTKLSLARYYSTALWYDCQLQPQGAIILTVERHRNFLVYRCLDLTWKYLEPVMEMAEGLAAGVTDSIGPNRVCSSYGTADKSTC